MSYIPIKKFAPWVLILIILTIGLYFSTHLNPSTENTTSSVKSTYTENQDFQDVALKQKLIEDFETAFLKQYTPPIGCEVFATKEQSAKCSKHLANAKNLYKDEFIKSRGLPKNTFEDLKLSFID